MGWGQAPALRRSTWKSPGSLLVMAFLASLTSITAYNCPIYCTCNITLQFYHVSCERSSLSEVPQRLPSKATTTLLDLKWNRISILRENALIGYHKLQLLNLEYNSLEEIDERAFRHSPELRLLQLAHNNLTKLNSDIFLKNQVLQFVDLSNNQLILPRKGPFLKSSSLLILNLSDTNLSEMPVDTFSEMRGLNQLDLYNNLLKTVSVDALSVFANKNVTVLLWGNPLHCDCRLKDTWDWVNAHVHAPNAVREEAICNSPDGMKGKRWYDMRTLGCGGSTTVTYVLYAIAGLLVLIAVLVGLVVWAVRRRRRRNAAVKGGITHRPKHRLAPPVGEYIEVIDDKKDLPGIKKEQLGLTQMGPVYEVLDDPKKDLSADDPNRHNLSRSPEDRLRYVPTICRSTYLPPMPRHQDEGPIYVNLNGPPLPLRRPSDVPPPPTGPAPPIPSAHPTPSPRTLPETAPLPTQSRPCSIPLLEGCDFYEVVD